MIFVDLSPDVRLTVWAILLPGLQSEAIEKSSRQIVPLFAVSTNQRFGLFIVVCPVPRVAPVRAWRPLVLRSSWLMADPVAVVGEEIEIDPGPRSTRVPLALSTVTTSPDCNESFVLAARAFPGGYDFADGPVDRTTMLFAMASVAMLAAITARDMALADLIQDKIASIICMFQPVNKIGQSSVFTLGI